MPARSSIGVRSSTRRVVRRQPASSYVVPGSIGGPANRVGLGLRGAPRASFNTAALNSPVVGFQNNQQVPQLAIPGRARGPRARQIQPPVRRILNSTIGLPGLG